MIDRFLTVLHRMENDDPKVRTTGINPWKVYEDMGFKGFHKPIVPFVTDYLVKQNVAMGRIKYNFDRIFLTNCGRS